MPHVGNVTVTNEQLRNPRIRRAFLEARKAEENTGFFKALKRTVFPQREKTPVTFKETIREVPKATVEVSKELAKDIFVKVPTKFAVSLVDIAAPKESEIPELARTASNFLRSKAGVDKPTTTFAEDAVKKINEGTPAYLAILETGSIAILDTIITGELFRGTAFLIKKGIKVPPQTQVRAWEALGRPATFQAAKLTYRALARKLHPDVGGSAERFSVLNDAFSIIKKEGIPKQRPVLERIRAGAEALETPVSALGKGRIPEPFIEPAGLLPGTAIVGKPQPAFGLSIRPERPVGKISKELEPLAVEARKFKTAEEFADEMLAFQPKGDRTLSVVEKITLVTGETTTFETLNKVKPALEKKGISITKDATGGINIISLDEKLTIYLRRNKSQLTDFFNQAIGKVVDIKQFPTQRTTTGAETKKIIRLTTGQVKLDLKEFEQRIRDLSRGAREGSLATRQDILKAGDEIKATLKKANVSPEDMKFFTDTFKNIEGVEDLAIKLPIINARIERLANAEEIRTLKSDVLEEIKEGKPTIGQKKALESKFGAEAQKQLDFLRGETKEARELTGRVTKKGNTVYGIRGNRTKALAKTDANIDKYGIVQDGVTQEIPQEVAMQNALLNMVGIQDMTVQELRTTLAQIKSLKETGQLEILRGQANKTAELELVKDTAKIEFSSAKVKTKVLGEVGEEMNPVLKGIDIMENAILGIRNIAEKITFGEFNVAEWLGEKIRVARNNSNRLGPEWNNQKVTAFKGFFGEEKLGTTYKEMSDEKLVWKGKDASGKSVEMKLSQFEAAYWFALAKDPTNIALFIKNMNFTPEMFSALSKFVDPRMRKYVDFLQTEWLKSLYAPVNTRYRAKFGMDMPNNPNYMPRIYSDKSVEEEITNLLVGEAFPGRPSTVPSGVKARIGSNASFRKISIEQVLRRHSQQMNQFVNFDEAISDLRRVFLDKEVKETIITSSGKQVYDTLIKKIDDIARGGMATQMKLAAIDTMIGRFTQATLMLNWVPFLKQLTSHPAFTLGRGGVTYPELVSGALTFAKNPVEWTKMFAQSNFIFGRLTQGFNRETALAFRRGDKNFTIEEVEMTLQKFLASGFITPTRGGDMVPILPGMTAKYLQVTKKLQRTTKLSKEQIHKRALAEAEKLASRTQQSLFIEDTGRIQTANSVGKAISMYSTTPIQYLRESIAVVRAFTRGQTNAKDLIRTIITAWIVLPQFFQWVSDGFEWSGERQLRALLLGPINYYPAAGNLMGTMYDAFAKGETWKSVASAITPLFSIPEKGQQVSQALGKIVFKDGDQDDWIKLAKKLYEVIALTTGKLPSSAPRTIEGVIDLTSGDTKDPRRLIYSEYALDVEKQTGKDVSPLGGGKSRLGGKSKLKGKSRLGR